MKVSSSDLLGSTLNRKSTLENVQIMIPLFNCSTDYACKTSSPTVIVRTDIYIIY